MLGAGAQEAIAGLVPSARRDLLHEIETLKGLATTIDAKIQADAKSSDIRLRQDIAKALSSLLLRFSRLPGQKVAHEWLSSYQRKA